MQIIPPTTNTMGSKALPVSPNAIKIRQVPISVAMVMPETGLELDPIRPTIRLETVTKKNPKTTMSNPRSSLLYQVSPEIGRASGRERVCQDVKIWGVGGY